VSSRSAIVGAVPHRTFDRSPWLLDPDVSYLNHGSFGGCPAPVLEAQRVWRERMEAEPARFLDRELEGRLDEVRHEVARFLGADPEGFVFVPNATTGVSTVLGSLRFQPGDELLAGDHEYNSSLNAMRAAAERDGARVVIARIPFPIREPSQAVEAYLEAVTPRTRLALVSHVTSPTALVMPVEALVRELDRRGVDTLVDGAHAPGMVDVDLGRLGAAFWTANAHKWLCAPKGVAVLHVRADLRPSIRPLVISHGLNDDRVDRPRFRVLFDWTGTYDPSGILALPAALRYVGGLDDEGWTGIMAANRSLARRARDVLCGALGLVPPVPDGMLGAMASVPLPGLAPTRAAAERLQAALFDEELIEVPIIPFPVRAALAQGAGHEQVLVRVSAQRYNRLEEYSALAESLARRLHGPSSPRALLGRLRRG
jgi:isopenicillin-N epimerase